MAGPPSKIEFLRDLEDPHYYGMPAHHPERQVVVLTSRIKEKVPALAKTRWLDQQLSLRQCPYPIQHIEFTHAGDAVVQFISEPAMAKALARPTPLLWGPAQQEIATRPCTEDDVAALFWVGVLGMTPDMLPAIRQALQPYGEVRGEYAPHASTVDPAASLLLSELNGSAPEFVPGGYGSGLRGGPSSMSPPPRLGGMGLGPSSLGSPGPMTSASSGMLKLYFAPTGRRRLPVTVQISRPDRPKGFPPIVARLLTPHGPLAPRCADFGANHSSHGCPECARRSQGN